MKKWLLCCCLLLALPLAAQAEDEKIDPANYICAEFVAQGAVSQDPPVFQALQIDLASGLPISGGAAQKVFAVRAK